MKPINNIQSDLQRPGGGWTVGFVTLFVAMCCFVANALGLWPFAEWTALIVGIVLFALHLAWGTLGYYPRQI